MARKTNKTNHVLGLLAGKNDETQDAGDSRAKAAERKPVEDSNVQVVAKQEEDDAIADTVKQLLEEELETEENGMPVIPESIFDDEEELEALRAAEAEAKELFEEEKRAEEEAKKKAEEEAKRAEEEEARKAEEEAKKAEEARAQEEEQKAAEEAKAREEAEAAKRAEEEAQRKAEEEAQAAAEEEAIRKAEEEAQKTEKEKEYVFLNVMETLVRERVDTYMDQFATCHCSRCKADIIALALTSLPSKYVVVSKNAATPLMNFYSQRYAGAITVEITKACTKVKEHPHHGRD